MTIVMRPTCWHQKFGPNGLSAPAQGLCLNVFSSVTADFNISSAIRWAIQDQWSSGLSVAWPTGVQLLVFFCSSVPVVLFYTPGISRCRSQHVSVESSSLLYHSIYLWFICFTWWSIDELENLYADRTTVCFEPWQKLRARLGTRKTGLSPPVFLYWLFQGGTSVVVLDVCIYTLVQLLC